MNRTVGYLIGAGLILSCSAWTAEAKNHKPHNRHAVVRAYPYRDPGAITPQDRRSLPPGLAKRNRLPPGLAKQRAERGELPPGLQKRERPAKHR